MANIDLAQHQTHSVLGWPNDTSAGDTSAGHNSAEGKGKSGLDVLGEIHALLGRLGESQIEPVAYDTAWIARLGHIDNELATQALAWLREHQLPDGGWGAPTPLYHHDRVISTLAAVIALVRNDAPEDRQRIHAALPALQHSLANLHTDIAGRTIAFEMLLPSLVAEARTLGLQIDDPDDVVSSMSLLRDAKLAHAPKGMISRHTTLGFSAEMVGPDGLHLLDLDNLQQINGSVSVSPAATAFYAAYVRPDPAALQYLRRIVQHKGAPPVTAIGYFESAWALWNLTRGRTIDPAILAYSDSLLDRLASAWDQSRGIAYDDFFSVPDGDNTGLIYELFARFGRNPDPTALWYYEDKTHFRTYELEGHTSISTNVHILGALRMAGFDIDHPSVQKIAAFLRREQMAEGWWVDKWHTSPYYVTSHAIIACSGYLDEVVEEAVNWIIATQNPDGAWGYFAPTAEETAYCLLALMARCQQGFLIPQKVLDRGASWLAQHFKPPYPQLWIIKTLYCPILVVQTAIFGALRQYELEYGALS